MVYIERVSLDLPIAKCVSHEELIDLKNKGEFSDNRNVVRPVFIKGFTIVDVGNRKIYIVVKDKKEDIIRFADLKKALYNLRLYMLLFDVGDVSIDMSNVMKYINIFFKMLRNFEYNFYLK